MYIPTIQSYIVLNKEKPGSVDYTAKVTRFYEDGSVRVSNIESPLFGTLHQKHLKRGEYRFVK